MNEQIFISDADLENSIDLIMKQIGIEAPKMEKMVHWSEEAVKEGMQIEQAAEKEIGDFIPTFTKHQPSSSQLSSWISQADIQHHQSPTSLPSWIAQEEEYAPHLANKSYGIFDVQNIRKDFTIFSQEMIWFDNAATTQKPFCVIDAMDNFLKKENSNIHRGAHAYARHATELYENARKSVAQFIHAKSEKEIIFVRGATEGINLVAHCFGENFIHEGDEIIISYLEHHSNILPWQTLARRKKAHLRVIPIDSNGDILIDEYAKMLSHRTKLVAITQVANSIGTVLPIELMTKMAKTYHAHVLIDAAQSIPHFDLNVADIGCDFLIFSGHKIYGPTGIGAVYGKEELLHLMTPYQTGGGMIEDVTFEKAAYAPGNAKFEAGTPNVVGAIGLQAALEYVTNIGLSAIAAYEKTLTDYTLEKFAQIPNIKLIGTPKERVSVVSFILKNGSSEDFLKLLDKHKIALRYGHHCAQPAVRFFGHEATIRPSFAFYNTKEEIDQLVDLLKTFK